MSRSKGTVTAIFLIAAFAQITSTFHQIWMGVSSASNGETRRATWSFIFAFGYAGSLGLLFWAWSKRPYQNSKELAGQVAVLQNQQQDWVQDRETLLSKIQALEHPIPQAAFSAYAPGTREAHIEEQWRTLNNGEKELVRFVLFNGTVALLQIINYMLKEGFADGVSAMKKVQSRTSFIVGNIGDLHPEFTINPELKADLMRLSR
jgi:hypothetical protein